MREPSNLAALADCYERLSARDIDWDNTDKDYWLALRKEILDVRDALRHALKRSRAEARNHGVYAPRQAYLRAQDAFSASGGFEQKVCGALGRAKAAGQEAHSSAFEQCFVDVCREALDLRLFAQLVTAAQERARARAGAAESQKEARS